MDERIEQVIAKAVMKALKDVLGGEDPTINELKQDLQLQLNDIINNELDYEGDEAVANETISILEGIGYEVDWTIQIVLHETGLNDSLS
jgi:hypothetical protein